MGLKEIFNKLKGGMKKEEDFQETLRNSRAEDAKFQEEIKARREIEDLRKSRAEVEELRKKQAPAPSGWVAGAKKAAGILAKGQDIMFPKKVATPTKSKGKAAKVVPEKNFMNSDMFGGSNSGIKMKPKAEKNIFNSNIWEK